MSTFSNTDTGSRPADPYKQKNIDETSLDEKVNDLVGFVDKSKFCMMTTKEQSSNLLVSRCMALAAKEANGTEFIFHTNSESGKTDDLVKDSHVNLAFLNPSGEWASISGIASVETGPDVVGKFYSPSLKAWMGDLGDGIHDGGPKDPRIAVIRVKAKTAQYALSKRTLIGGALEFAKGVATGEVASVNKLRYLNEQELKDWANKAL